MIRKFPEEEQISAEIRSVLGPQLEFAERVYSFWLLQRLDSYLEKSSLPTNAINVAMLCNLQGLRLFRSIVEDCYRGEGLAAAIASRSLFENVLAMIFVLKRQVRVKLEAELDSNKIQKRTQAGTPKFKVRLPKKSDPRLPNEQLSREHRADLYFAFWLFSQNALHQRCRTTKGLKRIKLGTPIDAQTLQEWEKNITPEWAYIQRERPHTYSGLSIYSLTKLLDRHGHLTRYYETIYHIQSRIVHAVDAVGLVEADRRGVMRGQLFSSAEETLGVLTTGTMGLLMMMEILNKHIDFGDTPRILLPKFKEEFHQLHG